MNSIVRDSKKTLICVVAHFTQSLTVQTRTPRLFVGARLASEYFLVSLTFERTRLATLVQLLYASRLTQQLLLS